MNVNYFGWLNNNPDNCEDESFGSGSSRPIGLSFQDIFNLSWTVRSFNCNFSTVSQTDQISQFLLGGGASFTILGALAGLSSVNLDGTDAVTGYTKISNSFKQKERTGLRNGNANPQKIYTWDGVQKGKTQTKISVGNNQKTFTYSNAMCYEGNSITGNVHILTGKVIIDFSNIKYYNRLYWPRIILTTASATSLLSGPQLLGGISFMGQLITMYSTNLSPLITVNVAFGSIVEGSRLNRETKTFDRFLYDGTDYYES